MPRDSDESSEDNEEFDTSDSNSSGESGSDDSEDESGEEESGESDGENGENGGSDDEHVGSKRKAGSDDESDVKVKFCKDDLEGIDSSNIIPRSRRRAAMASGLSKATPKSSPSAPAPGSSAQVKAPANFKAKSIQDDDEEAEF